MEFVPRNRRGARVIFHANYDWSFGLECGRFVLFEDEDFHGTEADHVDRVIEEIDSIARHGLVRSTLERVIRLGADRWRPWSEQRINSWLPDCSSGCLCDLRRLGAVRFA